MDRNYSSDIILISNSIEGKNQIIYFSGCLVYQNTQLAKEKLNDNFAEAKGYILDFSKLSQIDSTGFSVIFSFLNKKPKNSHVAAVASDEYILELLKITKIDQLVPLCITLSDALKLISE